MTLSEHVLCFSAFTEGYYNASAAILQAIYRNLSVLHN